MRVLDWTPYITKGYYTSFEYVDSRGRLRLTYIIPDHGGLQLPDIYIDEDSDK